MKKLVSLILAACLIVSGMSLAGCGNKGGEKIDKNKTQLYVSHFSGGFGEKWIYQMKEEFQNKYANVSFEDGKTGVQVIISPHKNTATNKNFDMTSDNAYVFFNENVPYGEFVNNNKLLDITDVVNGTFDINNVAGLESAPDFSDADKKIIDKFTDVQQTGLNKGLEQAPAYYAIPHYEGYYGLTYDAELFDKEGYYMYADGTFGAKSTSKNLSTGPDGEEGTYDDGLPNTYADFFNLCALISEKNIPMIFSGADSFYIMNVINALITDYNGYENEKLAYTFNGTSTKYVTGWNGDTPTIGEKPISNANGYDVFNQAGYYYGFDFLNKLINLQNKEYLYTDCFTESFTHTSAQSKYILSGYRTETQAIAMLAEGIWWQNEATPSFDEMAKDFPASGKEDRNFKFMPLPKATADEVGKGLTLLESQNSYIMIRSNMPEKYIPLAKLFLQFCNTTDALKKFTIYDNTPRALKYEVNADDMKDFSTFSKSIFEIKNDKNTKIIYQLSTNNLFLDNMGVFKKDKALQYGSYTAASNAMDSDENLTAKTYFEGLYNSWQNRWASEFSAYINN